MNLQPHAQLWLKLLQRQRGAAILCTESYQGYFCGNINILYIWQQYRWNVMKDVGKQEGWRRREMPEQPCSKDIICQSWEIGEITKYLT